MDEAVPGIQQPTYTTTVPIVPAHARGRAGRRTWVVTGLRGRWSTRLRRPRTWLGVASASAATALVWLVVEAVLELIRAVAIALAWVRVHQDGLVFAAVVLLTLLIRRRVVAGRRRASAPGCGCRR